MATSSPNARKRQFSLAIDQLAMACATQQPPDSASSKPWLSWLSTADFPSDGWTQFSIRVGAHMDAAGWPAPTPTLLRALELARERSIAKSAPMDEDFIAQAFSEGWKRSGPTLAACLWAQSMEAQRMVHIAPTPAQTKPIASAFSARPRLSAPTLALAPWREIIDKAPQTLPWLWDAAADGALRVVDEPAFHRQGTTEESDSLGANQALAFERAAACAQAMPSGLAQSKLHELLWRHPGSPAAKSTLARLADLLVQAGARWDSKPQAPAGARRGAPKPLCPALRAVEANMAECALSAARSLGSEVFWPLAHAHLAGELATTFAMPDYARAKTRALASIPGMPQATARLLLRAASCSAHADYPSPSVCEELAEAFKLLRPAASLDGASPWLFPGFSLNAGDRNGFSPAEERGPRDTAELWARRRGEFCRALESGRHREFPLAALISALAESGCSAPWESSELDSARIPSPFRALVEGWQLALSASEPATRLNGPRL